MNTDYEYIPRYLWLRRLAATFYDACLLIPFMMAGSALVLWARDGIYVETGDPIFIIWFFFIIFAFFAFFWLRGGQTLGMRAWRLKVVSYNNQPITQIQACRRALGLLGTMSSLGIGFWLIIFNRKQRTFHDWISKTKIIVLDPALSKAQTVQQAPDQKEQ